MGNSLSCFDHVREHPPYSWPKDHPGRDAAIAERRRTRRNQKIVGAQGNARTVLKDATKETANESLAETTPLAAAEKTPAPLTKEKPIEETPIEEKPIDEKPILETPTKEKPILETLIEEKPIEEKPIMGKPLEEATPVTHFEDPTDVKEDRDAPLEWSTDPVDEIEPVIVPSSVAAREKSDDRSGEPGSEKMIDPTVVIEDVKKSDVDMPVDIDVENADVDGIRTTEVVDETVLGATVVDDVKPDDVGGEPEITEVVEEVTTVKVVSEPVPVGVPSTLVDDEADKPPGSDPSRDLPDMNIGSGEVVEETVTVVFDENKDQPEMTPEAIVDSLSGPIGEEGPKDPKTPKDATDGATAAKEAQKVMDDLNGEPSVDDADTDAAIDEPKLPSIDTRRAIFDRAEDRLPEVKEVQRDVLDPVTNEFISLEEYRQRQMERARGVVRERVEKFEEIDDERSRQLAEHAAIEAARAEAIGNAKWAFKSKSPDKPRFESPTELDGNAISLDETKGMGVEGEPEAYPVDPVAPWKPKAPISVTPSVPEPVNPVKDPITATDPAYILEPTPVVDPALDVGSAPVLDPLPVVDPLVEMPPTVAIQEEEATSPSDVPRNRFLQESNEGEEKPLAGGMMRI